MAHCHQWLIVIDGLLSSMAHHHHWRLINIEGSSLMTHHQWLFIIISECLQAYLNLCALMLCHDEFLWLQWCSIKIIDGLSSMVHHQSVIINNSSSLNPLQTYYNLCAAMQCHVTFLCLQWHSIREQRGTHKKGKEWRLVIHGPAKRWRMPSFSVLLHIWCCYKTYTIKGRTLWARPAFSTA